MWSTSTNTISVDERTYGRLLGRTLPRVIHSDDECERLTSELMRLDEQKDSSPEEKELAELLTVLVGEYEGRRYPIRKSSPRRTLQHLMDARVDAKGFVEDVWVEGNYFGGVSRETCYQQNASEEAGRVFSCQRGTVYLATNERSKD